jgi:hypothetical protein
MARQSLHNLQDFIEADTIGEFLEFIFLGLIAVITFGSNGPFVLKKERGRTPILFMRIFCSVFVQHCLGNPQAV